MATPGGKNVKDTYITVVTDVINGVREAFLDEGMDEQVLQELRQLWESKLLVSKALEPDREHLHEPGLVAPVPQRLPTVPHPQQHQLQHQQQQPAGLQLGQGMPPGLNMQQRMSLSAQTATNALPSGMFQQFAQQQQQMNQFYVSPQYTMVAPGTQAPPTDAKNLSTRTVMQLDGLGDSSSEDDDINDDDDDNDDDVNDDVEEEEAEEENPLNSDDDVSDADPTEVFDAENVIVCQFDKINRSKNKWKFHLKDGIMNLNGRDQLFQKANGDADW